MYYLGGEIIADYVTVSAKIPRRLKELLDLYGVKVGPVVRRALEEEVRRRALLKIEERAKVLSRKLQHISDEEVARLIREDREGR
ncbi:MAG TPA: hypothetical protein ENG07_00015 [Candidatus Bathyarchaeota archaeon]|nr:hypothetical protein [Candidatus Bathyarchaeota archaeon]